MKKLFYIFLLACFLVFGMVIDSPDRDRNSQTIQDEIDEFEKEIGNPNNDYQPKSNESVDPNLSNSLAKTGENIINKTFDFFLEAINSLIQN
ncbi:MAG: hypothetical protein PHX62_02275 [Bacilli bacterium]|nr:hypothetical protein [Bacilli bacterium]